MREPTAARPYGDGASSFAAAGEEQGVTCLVEAFYRHMDALPVAQTIRSMHEADLQLSRAKLTAFLCAWLGGPNRYAELFGPISIPAAHQHLAIDEAERDAWLACMTAAVHEQPWAEIFKHYFLRAIAVPANRVRLASVARRAASER
ncbi:MAG: globin [Myxococcales bacterium]|nr:globin [Myxococcales bacterium]